VKYLDLIAITQAEKRYNGIMHKITSVK